tara:strand:- start:1586 stop:2104 length:519 start_codon:yes stop_codon:yes gene_type:complete
MGKLLLKNTLYFFTLFFLTNCEDDSSEKKYLFINEFLASNNSVYADEIGEYDDWVELYNSSSDPIDISGMYLADDFEDNLNIIPSSNQFSTIVPANGYLIIWFDKDQDQGPLHIGEKLSADGEGVYLYNFEKVLIDSVTFGVQETDISMGRYPDGSNRWVKFTTPTPAKSNN